MKTPTYALVATIIAFGHCGAQEEKKEEQIDIEARKASIPVLEDHIKEREGRMTEIANDIMRLDKRVEGQIDRIVAKLAGIKDSQESGYRVSQIKMQAIEGLGETIDEYKAKRRTVVQEIREGRSDIPKETLEGDAKAFDKRIEKRVEQILNISKSFTQAEDVKRYEEVSGGSFYSPGLGWNSGSERISEEWRQNRRDKTMNKKQRDEIIEALKKSIERKKSQIASYKDSLANRKLSKSDRDLVEAEMNRDIAILDSRQGQLEEMLLPPKVQTDSVNRDAALDIENALRDASDDLRQDLNTIFSKYSELNRERSKVGALNENLAARKKWIEDYEAKNPK